MAGLLARTSRLTSPSLLRIRQTVASETEKSLLSVIQAASCLLLHPGEARANLSTLRSSSLLGRFHWTPWTAG